MQAIEREILANDWITFSMIFLLVLIALMKLFKPNLLKGYVISFFTQGFFEKRAEKNPPFYSIFHGAIFMFSTLCIAMTIYFFTGQNSFYFFLKIFSGVVLFVFGKYSFDFFLEKLFNITEKTIYFRFTKIGYLYTCALWLFPVLIIYHFGFKSNNLLSIWCIFLLFIRFSLILKNNKKLILNKFFYFILYLCSLEITPLLILYKITTT